jgi:2-dehydro-3-deoxyphosphogluconate aldolase / (4S)-4-hydroxy-2-oxoglutarate aldolase
MAEAISDRWARSQDRVTRTIQGHGVLPVVSLESQRHAMPLGDALIAGGLPLLEVTLRTTSAMAAIRILSRRGDLLVGAGTVITPEQVHGALAAGAQFIVTPGLDEDLVLTCQVLGVPIFPGVATATDVTRAVRLGLDVVKLFPAALLGGVQMISALSAPFPEVRYIPTGGLSSSEVAVLTGHPAVLAVGGSWVATRTLLAEQNWERISSLAEAARLCVSPDRGVG